jgi:hypothetical protein
MAIPKKVSSADCNLKQPNSDDPPEEEAVTTFTESLNV